MRGLFRCFVSIGPIYEKVLRDYDFKNLSKTKTNTNTKGGGENIEPKQDSTREGMELLVAFGELLFSMFRAMLMASLLAAGASYVQNVYLHGPNDFR